MRRLRAIDTRCPTCDARPGRGCRGSRIPSANSFGGGWGGPSELARPHQERAALARRIRTETPPTTKETKS